MTVPAYVELQASYVHPVGPRPSRVPGERRPEQWMTAGKLGAHFRWHKDKASSDCQYCTGKRSVPTYTRHDGTVVPLVFEGTRRCGRCDRELPLSIEFFKLDSREPNGLGYWCRECCSRQAREWEEAHPDEARERHTIGQRRRRAEARAREEEAARKALPPECRWLVSLLNRKQLRAVLELMPDE